MSMDRRGREAIRIARALGDPTRFELLRRIAERGEICCRDLTLLFPLSQATISHHLRILSEASLVASRRAGQFSYFRPRPKALRAYGHTLALAFRLPRGARPVAAREPPSRLSRPWRRRGRASVPHPRGFRFGSPGMWSVESQEGVTQSRDN